MIFTTHLHTHTYTHTSIPHIPHTCTASWSTAHHCRSEVLSSASPSLLSHSPPGGQRGDSNWGNNPGLHSPGHCHWS